MKKERRKFSPVFNTKVVLESIREAITLQELASKYSLHPTQNTIWNFLQPFEPALWDEY